jgi:ubiquinone/menaquinone biosynthesis C-methylase UbiE
VYAISTIQLTNRHAFFRLLETFLELEIPELLGKHNGTPLSAGEICSRLGLHPHRGWKFLHCLALSGLLKEENGERGDDSAKFLLSDSTKEYFGANGDTNEGYYFRDLVKFWRYLNDLPVSLADVVRGADLPEMVQWPPKTFQAAAHLELWMRVTAEGAVNTLVASKAMDGATSILDVGGGDGSIGIALVSDALEQKVPVVPSVTVFNLPASAALAQQRILEEELSIHMNVVTGDFLKDELPGGFDRVLFSRVLTDWTPNVCKMLLEKARRALKPGGKLVINEAFAEGNGDYFVAWEYRYIFYDTFGRVLFKPVEIYKSLLEETGFRLLSISPMLDDAFYSVVVAEPVGAR